MKTAGGACDPEGKASSAGAEGSISASAIEVDEQDVKLHLPRLGPLVSAQLKQAGRPVNVVQIHGIKACKQVPTLVRAAAHITHTYLQPTIACTPQPDQLEAEQYLVLGALPGNSLTTYMRDSSNRPSWGQCAALGSQLADVLLTLHGKGVAYGQMTCDCVWLDGPPQTASACMVLQRPLLRDISVLLSCLGSTRRGRASKAEEEAEQYELQFVAPEGLSASCCTPAADVWSLGMILLAVGNGRHRPFGDITAAAVLERLQHVELPQLPVDSPPWYRTLLERMLDSNPSARPSAAEVSAACRSVAAQVGTQFFAAP